MTTTSGVIANASSMRSVERNSGEPMRRIVAIAIPNTTGPNTPNCAPRNSSGRLRLGRNVLADYCIAGVAQRQKSIGDVPQQIGRYGDDRYHERDP